MNCVLKLFLLLLWFCALPAAARWRVEACAPATFAGTVPHGGYSGIAWLGGNRYAVVDDSSPQAGYYLFYIDVDSVSGNITSVRRGPFVATGSGRDLEGVCYQPSADSVIVQPENGRYGYESLTYNAHTQKMWNCLENGDISLRQMDSRGKLLRTFPYQLDAPQGNEARAFAYAHGVSELCALDDGSVLVLEREFYVPKLKVGAWVHCKLYVLQGVAGDSLRYPKQLLSQFTTRLTLTSRRLANYEGMCLGPRLHDGSRALLMVSDSQNGYKGVLKDWFTSFRLYHDADGRTKAYPCPPPPDSVRLHADIEVEAGSDSLPGTFAPQDTLCSRVRPNLMDRLAQNRLFTSLCSGVPTFTASLLIKHQNKKFRQLRNDFLPKYGNSIDNYLQYTPGAVLLAMKALGVPSRSSWNRFMGSAAFSAALMGATVQTLKTTIKEERPDGSNHRSFPSGHTATAFMLATMLDKEYGHLSPWVSVGGYAIASATGLMRVVNNRHWLGDVMAGAAIGTMSTEFGYWIADALFKQRGLNRPDNYNFKVPCRSTPSFLSYYAGFALPLGYYDLSETITFHTSTGTVAGLEGAWFFSPYIGVGLRWNCAYLQYTTNGVNAEDRTLDYYALSAGPYFSLPLTPRFRLGTKLLAEHVYYSRTNTPNVQVPHNCGLGFGTGLSVNYWLRRHLETSIFLDYNIQPPHAIHSGEYIHVMVLGASLNVRL